MRLNTLGCDFCKVPAPAVETVELVRSGPRRGARGPRPGAPSVDLCEPHLRAILRLFRPRKRTKAGMLRAEVRPERTIGSVEVKREWDRTQRPTSKNAARDRRAALARAAKRALGTGGKRRYTEASFAANREKWAEVHAKRVEQVLAVLTRADHRLSRPEIDKATGLSIAQTGPVLRALLAEGQVTKYSNGPHARYESLASQARHGSTNSHAAAEGS